VTLAIKMVISGLLYGFWFIVFTTMIYRLPFFQSVSPNKNHLPLFFLLKVLAGILLTLVYTYYYTDPTRADIYRYYNDSIIISNILFQSPKAWFKIMTGFGTYDPDAFVNLVKTQNFSHSSSDFVTNNTLIIRVTVLLNYLTGYSIYGNTLIYNMLCFSGLVAFYHFLKPYFSAYPFILFFPLFLLPDVVFWNSGLLKGQLLFTCLGWFYYLLSYKAWWKMVINILILPLIYFIKPLIAITLMLSFPFLYAYRFQWTKRMFAGVAILFFMGVILVINSNMGTLLCDKLIDKHNEFISIAEADNAGSLLVLPHAEHCRDLLTRFPTLFFETFLGPFIWSSPNLFSSFFGVLNLLLIMCLIGLLVFFYQKPNLLKLSLTTSFLVFALLNQTIIALTVPVMGAVVHYRTIAIPFLVIALLNLIKLEKFIFVFRPLLNVISFPISVTKSKIKEN